MNDEVNNTLLVGAGAAGAKLFDVVVSAFSARRQARADELTRLRDHVAKEVERLHARDEARDTELEECRRDRAELHGTCEYLKGKVKLLLAEAGLIDVVTDTASTAEAVALP